MTGPLNGVRVLEIAGYITGPHASQLLADLGADVIKIEEPAHGDPFRGGDSYRPGFLAHNMREDARFRTWRSRIERYEEISAELSPVFASKPRAEWLRALDEADVPATPMYTVDETLHDPQARHLGIEHSTRHPTQGEVRLLGSPVRLSGTPLDEPTAPPTLGEHTEEILTELGYGPDAIQQLKASATV